MDAILAPEVWPAGVLGAVPVVRVAAPMPRLINNGFNCFLGVPVLHIPGLAHALPDDGRPIRQGHVMLSFADGNAFLSYTSTVRGDDTFSFI